MPARPIDVKKLAADFDSRKERAYTITDLTEMKAEFSRQWGLPRMSQKQFIEFLLANTKMLQMTLKSANYPPLVRFVWGKDTSPLSVALSIKRSAYCSHGTAMWLHGLGGDGHKLFVNAEQSEKGDNDSELTQKAIDGAFRNNQRQSRFIYKIGDSSVTVLSGKNTGRLEVEERKSPNGEAVPVTSLPRTLVDITVRPVYAGGAPAVAEAFRRAKGNISAKKVFHILQKLNYIYPYHQAIGFYLKCAGYPPAEQRVFARNINLDFYLCHGVKDPAYDKEWRVFVPRELMCAYS